MAEDAQPQGNSSPADAAQTGTPGTGSESGNDGGGSRVGLGVKAAIVTAAVGTAVAAAARSRGSSSAKTESDSAEADAQAPESRTARARGAVRRSEPILTAAWDAAKGSIEPFARNGSRQAGRFVAERSPDFVRENVIPPFVEGLTEDRPD